MSTDVTLPALGESVTEGTISRWLKEVGDTVEADEPLLEVSTDKVDTEIPSPVSGVLLEVKFQEDDVAQVGDVLAVVGDQSESGSSDGSEDSAAEQAEDKLEAEDTSADEAQAEEQAPGAMGSEADNTESDSGAPAERSSDQESSPSAETTEVTLPALGESVTEGTVSRWLKEVGDTVEADEPLLEVSTDKVDTEIPSPASGVLVEIKIKEDEVAEVGAVLALVGSEGARPDADGPGSTDTEDLAPGPETEQTPSDKAPSELDEGTRDLTSDEGPIEEKSGSAQSASARSNEEPSSGRTPAVQEAAARRAAESSDESTYVTPLVRKLAKEHGVDLASVKGTGVGGRIRKQDVLDAAKSASSQPADKPAATESKAPASKASESKPKASSEEAEKLRGTTQKLSRMRKVIATRMNESLEVAAQLTATVEVDLTAISQIRREAKDDFRKREGASLSYLPFITKAVVEALKAMPVLNARIDVEEGTVTYADAEHIGIAVDTERGLMVPVISDAGVLNLAGLAKRIGDLAARTRDGKVGPDELSGGTFTITNYGSAGTLFDTPIINQPEVAILGTGALVKRPVVVTDQFGGESIAVRDMMYLSLTYDHRLIDGAVAARFLSAIKARLEEGDFRGELGL